MLEINQKKKNIVVGKLQNSRYKHVTLLFRNYRQFHEKKKSQVGRCNGTRIRNKFIIYNYPRVGIKQLIVLFHLPNIIKISTTIKFFP